jgi:selenocysteine-specific elongation factor
MKPIIVGTAGHIDHGKTALVKALTGIDADRLEEEKRRGITIDLGFAHMELPRPGGENVRIGFVDVPGHERFVRNMLAGVGGIDLVLLVIAADESIKPQTREHLDILQLIGVKHGIAVLTKSDAVDAETLDVVRSEVEEFLQGTFLEPPRSPVVAVSSLTGAGLDDLKRALVAVATGVEARDPQALARLPIDRVFTMKGFGTVVTGTQVSGTIRNGDELEVFPTGRRVRVRGVQVHGQATEAAVAGQRAALNLAGASVEDLSRGMTLGPAAALKTTRKADVKLHLLSSAPRALKTRVRVHFHSHTMETVAELRFFRQGALAPGESGFARMVLPESALLLPGDRFIIRQFSPVVTIGGGVVLDASPMSSFNKAPSLAVFDQMLEGLDSGDRAAILRLRTTRRGKRGLSVKEAVAETGWSRPEIEDLAVALKGDGLLLRFEDRMFAEREWKPAQAGLLEAVAAFHTKDPLKPGTAKSELQDEMARTFKMAGELFEASLSFLVQKKEIEVEGEWVRLPGQGVVMKDEEAESKRQIEAAFASAGLKVPALADVLAGLAVDRARSQKIVTLLLREKVLVRVSPELVFHRAALEKLRRQLVEYKAKSSKIDVAQFKELTGVSRKYAIPLLEYLDRERVTRRVGDSREIF